MPVRLSFLVALLVLAGCDSGDPTAPSDCDSGLSGFFTARIDGQAFQAECYAVSFTDGVLVVAGSLVDDARIQRRFELIVPDAAEAAFLIPGEAEATFTITDLDDANSAQNRTYEATSGRVVITQAFLTNPSGLFEFTGQDGADTVAVTNGLFDVFR